MAENGRNGLLRWDDLIYLLAAPPPEETDRIKIIKSALELSKKVIGMKELRAELKSILGKPSVSYLFKVVAKDWLAEQVPRRRKKRADSFIPRGGGCEMV